MLPSLSTTLPWHGRVRELLAMHTAQEGSSMWWWAGAGGVVWGVLLVALMALRHVDPREHLLVRRLVKSSSASTGSDGAKAGVEYE